MRNQKTILFVVLICALGGLVSSCLDSDNGLFDFEAQRVKEVAAIDDYLADNSLQAIEDPSGIRMVITKLGTGLPAQGTDSVYVDYKGILFSKGTTFEESTAKGPLNGYINGWRIAFSKLPVGSEASLYIPSYFAYANTARPNIPANSTLIFDIKFKKIGHTNSYKQLLKSDTTAIDAYLVEKGITAVKDPTGIRYVITQAGSGPTPTLYTPLKASYSFKLLSDDTKTVISLDQVPTETFYSRPADYIQGLMVMFQKMQAGSKATLYLPSGFAFGPNGGIDDNGQTIIPANAKVIVDVELKEVL